MQICALDGSILISSVKYDADINIGPRTHNECLLKEPSGKGDCNYERIRNNSDDTQIRHQRGYLFGHFDGMSHDGQ